MIQSVADNPKFLGLAFAKVILLQSRIPIWLTAPLGCLPDLAYSATSSGGHVPNIPRPTSKCYLALEKAGPRNTKPRHCQLDLLLKALNLPAAPQLLLSTPQIQTSRDHKAAQWRCVGIQVEPEPWSLNWVIVGPQNKSPNSKWRSSVVYSQQYLESRMTSFELAVICLPNSRHKDS